LTQFGGGCFWRSGARIQMFATTTGWLVNLFSGDCVITFNAALSDCPPLTGWTVASNTCTGSPAMTLVCTTTGGGTTGNVCTSITPCSNCDETPSEIDVYFDSVIMYTECLNCDGKSYTVYRGTINNEKNHQTFNLTQSSPCTWQETAYASNLQINRYISDDCSGTPEDITGACVVTLTVGATTTNLNMTMAATTGEVITLFNATFAKTSCGLIQTIYSQIPAASCSDTVVLGHGGYAVVTPCGAITSTGSSSSSSPCQTVTPDIFSNTIEYFNSGNPIEPGTYTITYVSGAMSYVNGVGGGGGTPQWNVSDGFGNYQIAFNGGSSTTQWPTADDQSLDTDVAATQVGLSVVVNHTGGTLGVFCSDGTYGDNLIGPDTGAPTFAISPCPGSPMMRRGRIAKPSSPPRTARKPCNCGSKTKSPGQDKVQEIRNRIAKLNRKGCSNCGK
jgi:hypothetical protein